MVISSLDIEVGEKSCFFSDFDVMREYQDMDALSFILCSMRHPNEYEKAERYIEICSEDFRSDLFKWLNFRYAYKWN